RKLVYGGLQAAVYVQIVASHAGHIEALLELAPALGAIDALDLLDRDYRVVYAFDDEASHAVGDDLRHASIVPRDHRRAAGKRFRHHQAERLRPVDGEEQRAGVAEELILFGAAHLAYEFGERRGLLQERLNGIAEVVVIHGIDARRDLQRHFGAAGDLDGAVEPLFGRNAAEKREIVSAAFVKRMQIARQAVMHGGLPICVRQRQSLAVRDRNQRHVRIGAEQRVEIVRIEPPVQGCDRAAGNSLHQREMKVVAMEVNYVESSDVVEHEAEQ